MPHPVIRPARIDEYDEIARVWMERRVSTGLAQLFVAPAYQGQSLGRKLLAFTRMQMPDEMHLRCVRENDPSNGFTMKYYRWKGSGR